MMLPNHKTTKQFWQLTMSKASFVARCVDYAPAHAGVPWPILDANKSNIPSERAGHTAVKNVTATSMKCHWLRAWYREFGRL